MRYLCVHCDKTFEPDAKEDKPRCPECLRVNGLEEVAAVVSSAAEGRATWIPYAIAGAILLALGGGYMYWAGHSADVVGDEVPLAMLDRGAVMGHLRHRHVDPRQLSEMLLVSDEVEAFAEEAGGDGGSEAIAAAILETIRARAEAGAFEVWSIGVPRETPIAPPTEILSRLSEDGAHHHLYPLELSALMVSALRARSVPAMVAEVLSFPEDPTPSDPSGQFGYHMVAVFDETVGEGEPHFYDPYGGREVVPEARVLNDLQTIGAALNIRALHLLSRESDPERAIEASQQALQLDPRSPGARAVRGAILLVSGQPEEGIREIEAARQLRPDAARRNLVAGVLMARGDLEGASREISEALEESPDFAPGRLTLAAIHLARGEHALAENELHAAERFDPHLHNLPQLWAGYYASTGELDRAVQFAERAVEQNGQDIQARLMAARVYRQAGRYTLMREQAHAVIDHTPSARAQEMRALIRQMLGPTALEPLEEDLSDEDLFDEEDEEFLDEEDEDLDEDGDGLLGAPSDMQLGSRLLGGGGGGSSLLGGGSRPSLLGGGGSRPSLLGGGGSGPSLLGGDPSEGLQLDLGE